MSNATRTNLIEAARRLGERHRAEGREMTTTNVPEFALEAYRSGWYGTEED